MTNQTTRHRKPSGYNPITLDDVQPNPRDPFFEGLETPAARGLVAILFLLIFGLSVYSTVAAPLIMLILLGCLLFRMTPRERSTTATPLAISTVRLATEIAGPFGIWRFSTSPSAPPLGAGLETGSVFLPLFLAACLFFTSVRESNTGRVVFWYSLALLLSGLLPGGGYTGICAMLYYTLFFVILVTIVTDINPTSDARPLAMAPEPTRA